MSKHIPINPNNVSSKHKCSPNVSFTDGSCFTLPVLLAMATHWNYKKLARQSIEPDSETESNSLELIEFNNTTTKSELLSRFLKYLPKCQSCWLNEPIFRDFDNDDFKHNTFRPNGPRQWQNNWLSSIDITNVIKQYENKSPEFMFLGTHPINVDELKIPHVSNFCPSRFKNKTKFGIVHNTARSDQPGEHWIATYVDTEKNAIWFFDSAGKEPPKHVVDLMIRCISHQLNHRKKYKDLDVWFNPVLHQNDNHSCGIYAINFILRSLRGVPFEKTAMNDIFRGDEMDKCRDVFFRDHYLKNKR